jgi:Cdc6-like AAA superfamily ATPase
MPAMEVNVSADEQVKQVFSEGILKTRQLFMIGREEIHRRVQQLVDKFLKDVEHKGFILIRGTFGVGKTLILRKILYRIQEKINSN